MRLNYIKDLRACNLTGKGETGFAEEYVYFMGKQKSNILKYWKY